MTLRPLLFLLLAALLAGCAGPRVQPAPVVREHPLIGEARALAREQQALHGPARRAAAGRIEALLAQLDDATLAREAAALPAGDPLYAFAGRALLNRGLPLPRPFDRSQWKLDSADWPPAERDGYRPPTEVALLLPLSGPQAAVAAAVRDGYLAGYYDETRRRPQLRFYDTAKAGGAGAALARAVADGADLVVGPLAREEVDAVFGGREPPLPVLALNRGEHLPPAGDASFSLSPEDEGVAAAEFLLERGARRVLVVAGSEDVQQRAARALQERLQARGAQVLGPLAYRPGLALAPQTPAPDAVFLALKAAQARELAPRLARAGLAGIPRVATSQVALGTGKPAEDAALDGLVFPTETWSVRRLPGRPTPEDAAARVASARGPAARLFAFGYDAWLLTAYLEHLALDPNARVQGLTGRLGLDGFGYVVRQPSWSRFQGGRALPLDERTP
ncbi:penicillin-binding protein activator [Thermomonas flagellata]|uniref:penicillin-binding protein activator n=1 Tax=Thermomonas flagellata TaxID=2888524 RepID=UPI001F04E88C